ncbi:MAG: hypothetical protein HFJ03_09645 [Lachnospira sp.]|nr:hypothetical protein [Lachnospira sp.]
MKKKAISVGFLFLLLIGIIFAWNVGYLDDMKAVFKSEKNTEKQDNQKEAVTKSMDENNIVSTVEMNEVYIAEKIFEGKLVSNSQRWQIKATDCHISRELDFDLSVIETERGLQDKHKKCMDANMNFLKDYYYVTIELDVTSMNEDDWNIKEFNPHYLIFYMDNELGRVMEEPYGRIYTGKDIDDKHKILTMNKGETVHVILYYVVEDKYTDGPMYMSMYKQSQQLDEPDILLKETR